MIADTNSIIDFMGATIAGSVGGNTLFLGILAFIILIMFLLLSRARASTAVLSLVSFGFMWAVITDSGSSFMFIFWLGFIVGIAMIVLGIANKLKGG